MKQLYFILSILFIFNASPNAQDINVDSIFVSGNKSYKEQDFSSAIASYQSIIDSGYKSPELYLNIANAYFKTSQYEKAILYYEKASVLNPGDPDIQFNLQKTRAYTIDKIDMIPEFFLVVWFRKFMSVFSSNMWAILALAAFIIALTLFLFFFVNSRRSRKVMLFSIGLLLMLVSILSYSFARKTRSFIENSDQAIIMTSSVTVKGSPDADGTSVFIIHEGTKVSLIRSIGDWYEIKLADGKQGWLLKVDVEKI
jgi:tetratricopeptide (TPR) repeat protein